MITSGKTTWMARLANHRVGLAALSFAESTVVPIPLEALIVPLMVGHPKRAFKIAIWIWIGCLIGATVFYFIGMWLREPVVIPVIEWLGQREIYDEIAISLTDGGLFWTVFALSILPAPMQLATLGVGATGGNFAIFFAAIAFSRGVRYFGLALASQIVGERLSQLSIPKHKIMLWGGGVLVLGWVLYKLLTL